VKSLIVRMKAAASAHLQAMGARAVGAAAQQAVVGEPRVGALHRPALAERQELLGLGLSLLALLGDDYISEAALGALLAYDLVVIAPVEVEGLDLE
jgi:hypothetical protein